MSEIKIIYEDVTLQELKDGKHSRFNDPYGILKSLTPSMKQAFYTKPTGFDPNEVCLVLALDENKIVGCEMCFNSRVLLDGEVVSCQSATTLFAHPDYRKYGVGGDLMMICAKLHPLRNNFIAGISQMAQPIYKAMRYSLFSFPRFIYLKRSKCAIQYVLKTDNVLTKPLEWLGDSFLWCYRKMLFSLTASKLKGLAVERVENTPQEVEDMVLCDKHRFKEIHDKAWFDWCLNNRFIENDENSKTMFVVKNKHNDIVAFFVNRIEFFAQASTRGFKNVRLGTVAEWGIKEGSDLSESLLHLLAIQSMPTNVDGVQVATTDKDVSKKYRKWLFFPMGETNNAALIKSFKDKDIKDINNWRIRIAGGDTLIE